ncbi:MAG: hypothetical protein AAF447_12720 [Myxococcota bacterium]
MRTRATLALLLLGALTTRAGAQANAPAPARLGADALVSETQALRMEAALARAAYRLDPPQLLAAERSLLTAVYESYCAVDLLIPRQEGYRTVDVVLGVGCALGAAALYVASIRRFRLARDAPEAMGLLRSYQATLRQGPLLESLLHSTETRLRDMARRGRRRRLIEGVFGIANFVASATLSGLTARDRIDREVGVVVATGTASIGVISLASWFTRSSAEQALALYEGPLTPEAW